MQLRSSISFKYYGIEVGLLQKLRLRICNCEAKFLPSSYRIAFAAIIKVVHSHLCP
jgi:hypothetical protein